MKSINTITVLCPNADIQATKYRNQWIVNGRWIGTYQNWEVTPGDAGGSRKDRKVLRDSEIAAYVNEGTLPAGFESRSVISGGMGGDAAKAEIAEAAEANVPLAALKTPHFADADADLFQAFLAFKAAMKKS